MGGNAIKDAQRLDAELYFKVQSDVMNYLLKLFPNSTVLPIAAYKQKESFGDLDLLISSDNLPETWKKDVLKTFDAEDKEDHYDNKSVLSFRYSNEELGVERFQVDIIKEKAETLTMAWHYFSYNDLSNLLGRISKKVGFKLAHDGLYYIERDGDDIYFDERFSMDYGVALDLLGIDLATYVNFETLEDIFKFVASSPYFNPDIYLLHNRNYTSRVRDRKRSTYNAFLKWCEEHNENLTHFPYESTDDYGGYGCTNNRIGVAVDEIMERYPKFHERVLEARERHYLDKSFEECFNANFVMNMAEELFASELKGKELGQIMSKIKPLLTNDLKKSTINGNRSHIKALVYEILKEHYKE